MLSDPDSVKSYLKGCSFYQVNISSLRTPCPNSDVNALLPDKIVQTASMGHGFLWKCWSRPKLFHLIGSLALSGPFSFPEPFSVPVVCLPIPVGAAGARCRNRRAVLRPGWLRGLASAFTHPEGQKRPSPKSSPRAEITLNASALQTRMTTLAVKSREVSCSKNPSCLEVPEPGGGDA